MGENGVPVAVQGSLRLFGGVPKPPAKEVQATEVSAKFHVVLGLPEPGFGPPGAWFWASRSLFWGLREPDFGPPDEILKAHSQQDHAMSHAILRQPRMPYPPPKNESPLDAVQGPQK